MKTLKVAVVFYDCYAPLDLFGPIQAMDCTFGLLPDNGFDKSQPLFEIYNVSVNGGEILTSAETFGGPKIVCEHSFDTLPAVDVVLIPGGNGSRDIIKNNNVVFISKLKELVFKTPYVLSVCTGAALLAKTGFLDGKSATSNKTAWKWVIQQSNLVDWQCKPRWIDGINPGNQFGYMTSAGVSAGIDMTIAFINKLFGDAVSDNTQQLIEYTWSNDPTVDAFSHLCPTC